MNDVYSVPASKEEEYRKGLRDALTAGYASLRNGGEAMDAAVAAVTNLEGAPVFFSGLYSRCSPERLSN